ncbi:ATP-binding protein [Candidatus Palauibacter sp.]|uniref:ATP-binding protein n=1 Tax=Candidatus Palauibacter sp. TaxID=3101350 RepID=UPI003B0112D8
MLANFDFSFQPSNKREQIDSLHEPSFLDRKENVVFLGPTDPVTYCTTFLCDYGVNS